MMKLFLYFICIALGLYLSIATVIYFSQEKMLFHPRPVSESMRKHLQPHAVSYQLNGETLQGWLVNPDKKDLLIYYGGNAEELSYLVEDLQNYQQCASLLMNYRGYGDSTGKPSEEAFFADALALFDELMPNYERIILCGRSLGSGIACYVASQREVVGCILITPYDSMQNTAQETLPWLPMALVCKHKFDSVKHIEKMNVPGLFIIAGRDEVISTQRSQGLYDAWNGKKEWKVYPQQTHNSYQISPNSQPDIGEFLDQHFH